MMDVGMAIAAMRVDRQFQRKTSTTSAASTEPVTRCSSTVLTDARMKDDMSRTTTTSYPGGVSALRSASRSVTASTICTTLTPDWRRIASSTVGLPLTFARVVASAIPSSMVATSRSRIGWPSRSATTTSPNSWTDCTRPRVRSVIDWEPASTRPPGISAFCACSARETSVTVRFCACRRAGSSEMLTWRCRPPTTTTWPTPLTLSSCRRSVLSAYSVMSRIGLSADTASVMTGEESGSNFSTVGCLIARGSCGRTRFTRSRTSCAATSTSFSRRNEITTMETPSEEVDRSSSIPLIVLTASSILSEISVSTSPGAAPGSLVVTTMVGKSTFGKRSRPRRQ